MLCAIKEEAVMLKIENKEVPRAYVKTFKSKGWKVKKDNPESEFVTMTKKMK